MNNGLNLNSYIGETGTGHGNNIFIVKEAHLQKLFTKSSRTLLIFNVFKTRLYMYNETDEKFLSFDRRMHVL